jgi:NADPH:quinone reductase-like Zn-dependent oxidoreductase
MLRRAAGPCVSELRARADTADEVLRQIWPPVKQLAFDWTAQHVLVTGGTSGIGLAFARTALRRGARVSAIARNRRQLAADGPDAAVGFTSADVGDDATRRHD